MDDQDSLLLLQGSKQNLISKIYFSASASPQAFIGWKENLIKAFATESEPQPFHLDGATALARVFPGIGRERLAYGSSHDAPPSRRRTPSR